MKRKIEMAILRWLGKKASRMTEEEKRRARGTIRALGYICRFVGCILFLFAFGFIDVPADTPFLKLFVMQLTHFIVMAGMGMALLRVDYLIND